MCVGISSDIRVEFAVSCGKLKRPGVHPELFLHFRPEGCLLDYRGAVRVDDVLGLNIQIHDRIDLDGQR